MKKNFVAIAILFLVLSFFNFPNSNGITNETKIEEGRWILHDVYSLNLTSTINGTKQTNFAGLDISSVNPYQLKLNIVNVFDKTVLKPVDIDSSEFFGENRNATAITNTKVVPHVNATFYDGTQNIYNATINTESWENQIRAGPQLTVLNRQSGELVAAIGDKTINNAFGIAFPPDFSVVQLFNLKTPIPEAGDFSEPFIPVTSIKAIQKALVESLDLTDQETLTSKNNKILNLTNPYFSSPYPFFIHNNLTRIREIIEDATVDVSESNYKNTFSDTSLIEAYLDITKNYVEFTNVEFAGKFTIVFKAEFEYVFNQNNIFDKTKIGDSENPQYSYFYTYTLIGNTNTGLLEHYSSDQIVNTTLGGANGGTLTASRYDRMAFSFNNSFTSSPVFSTSSSTSTGTSPTSTGTSPTSTGTSPTSTGTSPTSTRTSSTTSSTSNGGSLLLIGGIGGGVIIIAFVLHKRKKESF